MSCDSNLKPRHLVKGYIEFRSRSAAIGKKSETSKTVKKITSMRANRQTNKSATRERKLHPHQKDLIHLFSEESCDNFSVSSSILVNKLTQMTLY